MDKYLCRELNWGRPLGGADLVLACLGAKQHKYAPAIVQSNLMQGVDMTRTIIEGPAVGTISQLIHMQSSCTCH